VVIEIAPRIDHENVIALTVAIAVEVKVDQQVLHLVPRTENGITLMIANVVKVIAPSLVANEANVAVVVEVGI